MSWIKSLVIIGIITGLTLKSVDLVFPQFVSNDEQDDLTLASSRTVVLRELDPNQTLQLTPSNDYLLATDSLEKKAVRVALDNNGFLVTGNEKVSSVDELSILFLGGSTTEALYVSEKSRFPSVVERNLRVQLESDVSVYNGGVSGNHSVHSLVQFLAKGIPLEPEFVVLMHNINDLAVLTKSSSYWVTPESRAIVKNTTAEKGLLVTALRSVKNLLIPNIFDYLEPRLLSNASKDEFEGAVARYTQLNVNSIENSWRSSLVSFVHIARAWNSTPVLMTQFNRNTLNDAMFEKWFLSKGDRGMSKKEFVDLYAKFNEIVREIAAKENVPLIDLAARVPQSSRYLYDTVHLNDEGSLFVADIISTAFVENIVPEALGEE